MSKEQKALRLCAAALVQAMCALTGVKATQDKAGVLRLCSAALDAVTKAAKP